MLHHSDGGTVVGRFRSAAKGDVVVLYESRALDDLAKVGIVAQVDDVEPSVSCSLSEFLGVEHLLALIDRLKADAAVVGDVEGLALALLRGNLDDTCGTTATILGGL